MSKNLSEKDLKELPMSRFNYAFRTEFHNEKILEIKNREIIILSEKLLVRSVRKGEILD